MELHTTTLLNKKQSKVLCMEEHLLFLFMVLYEISRLRHRFIKLKNKIPDKHKLSYLLIFYFEHIEYLDIEYFK